jgi:hypothetical protein
MVAAHRIGPARWRLVTSAVALALRDGRIKIAAPRRCCAMEVNNSVHYTAMREGCTRRRRGVHPSHTPLSPQLCFRGTRIRIYALPR